MKDFLRKVIANLIIISIVLADFLPLGLSLVSYADEQKFIDYSVNFVEISEEKQEDIIDNNELNEKTMEGVPLEEGTPSDVYNNEDFSLLGVSEEINTNKEFLERVKYNNEEEKQEVLETTVTTNNEGNLPLGPAIEIKIKMNGRGYLKNGKIEIKNYDSQLFTIKENAKKDNNIYSIVDNKIKLNQINSNEELIAYIPISIKDNEAIDIDLLQEGTVFNFLATYIGENGYEEIITLSDNAVLNMENDYSLALSCFVEKYIPYIDEEQNKALVQIKTIGSKIGEQVLPAKKTSYEIELPIIEGIEITNVNVFAISTAYTNALSDSEVQFSVENWDYNDGKITITVENNPRDGLYYKSTGNDEFIINYTLVGDVQDEEDRSLKATMKSEIYNSSSIAEKAIQEEYSFSTQDTNQNIITYEISGKTKEISKGSLIGNLNRELEDNPIEYENSLNINISRVELINEILITETDEYYEDEYGKKYPTRINAEADSFYKEIRINKDNLDTILGDSGYVELTTTDGEVLIVLNKETPDAGDGFVRLSFGDNVIDKLNILIKNPAEDGVLNITATKNIFKTGYDKIDIMKFKAIVAEYSAKASLDMDIETDMGSAAVVTLLKDTFTDARISVTKQEISTIVKNEGIELTLALNNAEDYSDMYSNPVFEIVFPKEIEEVNLVDYNLLYGNDELFVKNVENLVSADGRLMLKVSLSGKQTQYTAGDSKDGTKLIIKADVTANLFEASKISNIVMNYYNEDASRYSYEEAWAMEEMPSASVLVAYTGKSEAALKIVAPEGIVNATQFSNYNKDRKVISVKQGFKEDYIETFADFVVAKNTLISINNTGFDIDGYKILGRTAFDGNTSILSHSQIGTNITAPMISKINEVKTNGKTFTYYYSENGEATEELEDVENGWKQEVTDFRNIKSFLIVANETIKNGESIMFDYDFEIPNNLKNQIDIGSCFASVYSVNGENVWTEADKVLLSTGEMPLLDVNTSSDIDLEEAFEGQRIKYTTKITNVGNVVAKNVEIENKVPEGTTLIKGEKLDSSTKEFTTIIPEIRPQETNYQVFEVEVNRIKGYVEGTIIEPKTKVKADGLETYIYSKSDNKIPVSKEEIKLEIDTDKLDNVIGENELTTYTLKISNVDAIDLHDCEIIASIPDGLEVIDSYEEQYNGENVERLNRGRVDLNERKIYWHANNIELYKVFKIEAKTRFIEEKTKEIPLTFTLKSGSLKSDYTANKCNKTIGKPVLEAKTFANTNNKYIKEGENIQFVLNIKNVGGIGTNKLNLQNSIPKEFTVTDVAYYRNGEKVSALAVQNPEVNIDLGVGEETQVVVNCLTNNLLNSEAEKLTNNSWSISAANIQDTQTESVQTIIEQNPNVTENTYEDIFASNIDTNSVERRYEVSLNDDKEVTNEEVKKYRITGIAFEDLNKNGEFDKDERVLENVVAKLCDVKTQKVISQTVSNKAGEYLFEDLEKGEYYIRFEFDKDYYGVTSYKKSGIRENKNSDAILSNGRAVTDKIKIKDKSISDVNIGLAKTGVFDMEINANVSRMVVFKDNGTEAYNADNGKLAKFDFFTANIKNISSTVEYDVVVTNKGEVPGSVKQIKCNLSDRLTLESGINPEWYTGSDGKVYSTALGDTLLNPGESKTIKLYLYKENNEEGLYVNDFEITKEYNQYALEDSNINNNKASADYVIEKSKGINILVYILGISMTFVMLIVVLYMLKFFMETRTAKEYEKIEKEKKN